MARPGKLLLCVAVILFSALACGQVQPPIAIPTASSTATELPALEPAQTLATTDTQVPPPPAPTETATLPPTLPAVETGVFQRVTALPAPLPDSYSEVQVGAPPDGTAWVITSQGALRWDNQSWEAMLSSEEEGGLASVDDRGRLWVLLLNTGEIAAWQNGDWAGYGEESGWTQVEAASHCGVTQPRINDLLRGRISRFSLDALVNIAAALGRRVHVELEAA